VVALIDDQKTEQREQRAEPATRERLNAPRGQQQRAASEAVFKIAPRLATLGFRRSRGRRVRRPFGPSEIRSVSSAARVPAFFADAADILGKPHQRAGLLGAKRPP